MENVSDVVQSDPDVESAILHRSLHEAPHKITHGKGNYLYREHGEPILDATGGAAVSCLGHGNDRVEKAIVDQLQSISYCHSACFTAKPVEDLARFIIDSTYGDMARAFFVSSGSEAVEAALKFARQYFIEKLPREPERINFICRKQSYHGTTLGALSAGGHTARRALFEPMLGTNVGKVSPCNAYRPAFDAADEAALVELLAQELEDEFQRLGPHTVAAFIAEPIVGAALGCVPALPGYFQAMKEVCKRHGALLIMDEIMGGCGRTCPVPTERYPQPLHAYQDPLIGTVPDILTIGKGLGGGFLPIAGMIVGRIVVDTLQKGSGSFVHGQTFQGHPIACRSALEVQRVIREGDLVARAAERGRELERLLKARLADHPHVGSIRGKGLFWAIEFVANKDTKQPFDPALGVAEGLHTLGLKSPYNITLYHGTGTVDGVKGDHFLLAPAYNCTPQDIQMIVERTAAVVEAFFSPISRVTTGLSQLGHGRMESNSW